MSRLLTATAAVALLFSLSACDASDDVDGGETRTITELAAANSNLTTLVTALQAAGLDDDLDGTAEFTVFAPTNAAFDNVQTALLDSIIADVPTLDNLLSFHVVQGVFRAADLSDGQTLTAVNGDPLVVAITDDGTFVDGVEIAQTDIEAANGVIHVVEDVLISPIDIVDAAGLLGFTELASALTTAGLVDDLQGDGPFTVFAPTDAAFEEISDTIDDFEDDDLENVLLYHVVEGEFLAADLTNGLELTTLSNGQTISIDIDGSTVVIDGDAMNGDVVVPDVVVGNGVIHAIDGVLVPSDF